MKTEIIPLHEDGSKEEEAIIARGAEFIREGKLVVFPTETVYGLGGNALDAEAAKKIYAAKGRPSDNPLIIHIADIGDAEHYCETSDLFYRLACAFWPGPLTMIMKKKPCIPDSVTGGMDTVAVRLPSNPTANTLIRLAGVPIAAPSANLSGHPSPTTKEHVIFDLDGRVDMILAGNPADIGLESTVIKLEDDRVILLRPGGVTYEDLCTLLGKDHVTVDRIVLEKVTGDFKPISPGMKYRHYAPKAPVILLNGTEEAILAAMKEKQKTEPGAAFLIYDEDKPDFEGCTAVTIGPRNDPAMQAHRLFACLRAFDDMENVTVIYARIPGREGIGLAVYNRLAKAAGFTVQDV
ncbi:MAG: threonylcarbamoyl-AMP synthase [Clostridia bacterium]|nr:threonylcarbamoyl-AMP synthase [Clostridia bacterium]